MPVLDNAKHEAFAQHVASGATATKAAQLAGFSEKSARFQGSKLLRQPHIVARVAEIKLQAAAPDEVVAAANSLLDATIDRAFVLSGFKEVALRCLQHRPVLDKKGKPVLIETPAGDLAPAYVFDSAGANRALEMLGKSMEVGLFTVDPKDRKLGDFKDLNDGQLEHVIRHLASELSAEELAAFGLARTGITIEGESTLALPPVSQTE